MGNLKYLFKGVKTLNIFEYQALLCIVKFQRMRFSEECS